MTEEYDQGAAHIIIIDNLRSIHGNLCEKSSHKVAPIGVKKPAYAGKISSQPSVVNLYCEPVARKKNRIIN